MSPAQMKKELKRANPDKKWMAKVDRMSATEVAAIYQRLVDQKKIEGES